MRGFEPPTPLVPNEVLYQAEPHPDALRRHLIYHNRENVNLENIFFDNGGLTPRSYGHNFNFDF